MEKNEENKDLSSKKIGQKQIAGAILIVGVLIAGSVLLKGSSPKNPEKNPNPAAVVEALEDIKLKPISDEDHIIGNKEASVVIVEYSDTQCPFCKRFHETMHQIIKEKGNDIAWVYRHFPIPQLHPNANLEAMATECAAEQKGNEGFWQYIDELYASASSENNSNMKKLSEIAQSLNLNMDNFDQCVKDKKFSVKVQENVDSGIEAGVNGTPKSFILKNGKIVDTIDGAYPYEMVIEKIEAALK